MNVRLITAQETLPLRHEVLKPFLQLHECLNPGDTHLETFHLGVFENSLLVCVGSFEPALHPEFPTARKSFRLRGMATHPSFQGKGYGKVLLQQALVILKAQEVDFFWCNARIKAFGFYQNLGMQFHGDLFEIDRIGPHKVMYLWLDQDQISPS